MRLRMNAIANAVLIGQKCDAINAMQSMRCNQCDAILLSYVVNFVIQGEATVRLRLYLGYLCKCIIRRINGRNIGWIYQQVYQRIKDELVNTRS